MDEEKKRLADTRNKEVENVMTDQSKIGKERRRESG